MMLALTRNQEGFLTQIPWDGSRLQTHIRWSANHIPWDGPTLLIRSATLPLGLVSRRPAAPPENRPFTWRWRGRMGCTANIARWRRQASSYV